jgi:hypothetical protein
MEEMRGKVAVGFPIESWGAFREALERDSARLQQATSHIERDRE